MHGRSQQRGREEPAISLVLPAYNPGPQVEATWREVSHFLDCAPGSWEVLFVCDGCTDGTPARLEELTRGSAHPVRVLAYAPNRGKGHAVRHGLSAARGKCRVFTDVDLAYRFEDVLRVVRTLQQGAEVAIASRTHRDSRITMPVGVQGYAYRRHLQSLVFSGLARLLLPVPHRDLQAGLKGLSARAAQIVLPNLTCDGFGFDCELLTACARYGFEVTEVPVHVRYEDQVSTTNFRTMGRMVADLWKIRRTWRHAPPVPAVPLDADRRDAA